MCKRSKQASPPVCISTWLTPPPPPPQVGRQLDGGHQRHGPCRVPPPRPRHRPRGGPQRPPLRLQARAGKYDRACLLGLGGCTATVLTLSSCCAAASAYDEPPGQDAVGPRGERLGDPPGRRAGAEPQGPGGEGAGPPGAGRAGPGGAGAAVGRYVRRRLYEMSTTSVHRSIRGL